MKDIQFVVREIVSRVSKLIPKVGQESKLLQQETLAAFIAKSIVLNNADKGFQLNKSLNDETVEQLIELSVNRLLEKDSPSLETIKMQVAFDLAYIGNEQRLEKEKHGFNQTIAVHNKTILSCTHGEDYETINALYRQIFRYLVTFNDQATTVSVFKNNREEKRSSQDEREIAAALESVYPKIGLKAFIGISDDEKKNQLCELANVVMGIRLFNKEIGKGGGTIPDLPGVTTRTCKNLGGVLEKEIESLAETCQCYTETIAYTHRQQLATPSVISRWQDELINRRQYCAYLSSILEDVLHSQEIVMETIETINQLFSDLKVLVGSRTSVPKDQVYPRFDSIAVCWRKIQAEKLILDARGATFKVLQQHYNTFTPTLDYALLEEVREVEQSYVSEGKYDSGFSNSYSSSGAFDSLEMDRSSVDAEREHVEGKEEFDEESYETVARPKMSLHFKRKSAAAEEEKQHEDVPQESKVSHDVTLLSVEDTPDFMHLPLEYQGFCPWTLTERGGLLLPGDPNLGVVEYNNTFNVFASKTAQLEFMKNPEKYASGVVVEAKKSPELINLLHLQNQFPESTLSHIVYSATMQGTVNKSDTNSTSASGRMIDAATETPVHFVEKHIDYNYEFSEWTLRRKALQLANLRNVTTQSCQTEKSHFRRDGETQVYLPKQKGTQTGINKATNPPRRFQYVTGLRGNQPSKYVKGGAKPNKAHVVEMTFEL